MCPKTLWHSLLSGQYIYIYPEHFRNNQHHLFQAFALVHPPFTLKPQLSLLPSWWHFCSGSLQFYWVIPAGLLSTSVSAHTRLSAQHLPLALLLEGKRRALLPSCRNFTCKASIFPPIRGFLDMSSVNKVLHYKKTCHFLNHSLKLIS